MKNHMLLSDILFQSKQLHHQRRFSQNSSNDMYHHKNNTNQSKNLCLLGSLEFKKKQSPSQIPFMNKFQIVQLKKNKHKFTKQKNNISTHFQSQLKTRQIHSHRNSFKVKKLEQSHLGLLENSFSIKYLQNSQLSFERQSVRLPSRSLYSENLADKKINFSQRNSALNIETLPSKFLPNKLFQPQKSQQAFYSKIQKPFHSQRQLDKKNLILDFNSISFNLNEVRSFESPKKLNSALQIQKLLLQNSPQFKISNTRQKNRKILTNLQNQEQKNVFSQIRISESPRKNMLKKIHNLQKQHQQKLQLQKKIYLQIRKQVNKNYGKPFQPPENISAQSYIVYQITKKSPNYRKKIQMNGQKRKFINGHKVLAQFNSRTPCEIASLTKIMTLIVALQISQQYLLQPSLQLIKIGNFESKINGTSANLQNGQIYNLEQLFYGLMLPSGNDASVAIAVWGGQVLKKGLNEPFPCEENLIKKKRFFYERFLEQMNKKAKDLKLQKTNFSNSHGLMNPQNKSCAFDLALLCQYALKNEKFRQIVQTKRYECTVQIEKQDASTINSPSFSNKQQIGNQEFSNLNQIQESHTDQGQDQEIEPQEQFQEKISWNKNLNNLQRQVQEDNKGKYFKNVVWQNTHLLLHQKPHLYKGIKTGVTNSAGPCLASFVEQNQHEFIFIVLNCKTMKQRFRDTQNLRKWAFQKEEIKFSFS